MMSKMFVSLALVACTLGTASAVLETLAVALPGLAISGTALGAASAGSSAVLFLGASTSAVAGGAVLLKALAFAKVLQATRGRGKRSVTTTELDEELAFATLALNEPAACYRRLICDLATGAMPKSDSDVIVTLFDKPVSAASPKFEFATAAQVGKAVKSTQMCEVRYSCPLSTADIQKLFN